jgi:hypothetical protein
MGLTGSSRFTLELDRLNDLQQKNNAENIGTHMQNVSQLKGYFDRLPVTTENYPLYQRLLDLDRSVFKPLMEEIIAGRLDIEDTRPLFNIHILYVIQNVRTAVSEKRLPRLIQTPQDLKQNLINRAFAPNEVIKEITLPNLEINDFRMIISEQYAAKTGETLSEREIDALIVAVSGTKEIDALSGDTKADQLKYADAMATKPVKEY